MANTLSVFSPTSGNPQGFGSVLPAAIYAILAFIGFEAAAPIGEESDNPKRNVPVAMLVAVSIGTVLYLLTSYAAAVFVGPEKMKGFPKLGGGAPWTYLGEHVWIPLGVVVFLVLLNSIIANLIGGSNATTRMTFSLARAGGLPSVFSRVQPDSGAPIVAIRVLIIASIGLSIVLGFTFGGGPLDVFALFATTLTVLVLVAYLMVAVSCTVFYLREKRSEFNVLLHGVVPALAFVILVPVLIASLGIRFAGLDIAPVVGSARLGLVLAVVWLVIGLGIALFLTVRRPEVMRRVSATFVRGEFEGTHPDRPDAERSFDNELQ